MQLRAVGSPPQTTSPFWVYKFLRLGRGGTEQERWRPEEVRTSTESRLPHPWTLPPRPPVMRITRIKNDQTLKQWKEKALFCPLHKFVLLHCVWVWVAGLEGLVYFSVGPWGPWFVQTWCQTFLHLHCVSFTIFPLWCAAPASCCKSYSTEWTWLASWPARPAAPFTIRL